MDIVIYTDWKSALEENWEQDFKDIFPSLDEALKECYKFYPKTAVDDWRWSVTLPAEMNKEIDDVLEFKVNGSSIAVTWYATF